MNYIQTVYSEPRRTFVEKYLTNKGKRLIASAQTKKEKALIWLKYGKNRYRNNPNARPLYQIRHYN